MIHAICQRYPDDDRQTETDLACFPTLVHLQSERAIRERGGEKQYVVNGDVLYAGRPAVESKDLVCQVDAFPRLEVLHTDTRSTRPF
jgi:hypothetical protein